MLIALPTSTYIRNINRRIPYIGKFLLLKKFRANHENLTHDIFLTMTNYHGQRIVTGARACLIFLWMAQTTKIKHHENLTRKFFNTKISRYTVIHN